MAVEWRSSEGLGEKAYLAQLGADGDRDELAYRCVRENGAMTALGKQLFTRKIISAYDVKEFVMVVRNDVDDLRDTRRRQREYMRALRAAAGDEAYARAERQGEDALRVQKGAQFLAVRGEKRKRGELGLEVTAEVLVEHEKQKEGAVRKAKDAVLAAMEEYAAVKKANGEGWAGWDFERRMVAEADLVRADGKLARARDVLARNMEIAEGGPAVKKRMLAAGTWVEGGVAEVVEAYKDAAMDLRAPVAMKEIDRESILRTVSLPVRVRLADLIDQGKTVWRGVRALSASVAKAKSFVSRAATLHEQRTDWAADAKTAVNGVSAAFTDVLDKGNGPEDPSLVGILLESWAVLTEAIAELATLMVNPVPSAPVRPISLDASALNAEIKRLEGEIGAWQKKVGDLSPDEQVYFTERTAQMVRTLVLVKGWPSPAAFDDRASIQASEGVYVAAAEEMGKSVDRWPGMRDAMSKAYKAAQIPVSATVAQTFARLERLLREVWDPSPSAPFRAMLFLMKEYGSPRMLIRIVDGSKDVGAVLGALSTIEDLTLGIGALRLPGRYDALVSGIREKARDDLEGARAEGFEVLQYYEDATTPGTVTPDRANNYVDLVNELTKRYANTKDARVALFANAGLINEYSVRVLVPSVAISPEAAKKLVKQLASAKKGNFSDVAGLFMYHVDIVSTFGVSVLVANVRADLKDLPKREGTLSGDSEKAWDVRYGKDVVQKVGVTLGELTARGKLSEYKTGGIDAIATHAGALDGAIRAVLSIDLVREDPSVAQEYLVELQKVSRRQEAMVLRAEAIVKVVSDVLVPLYEAGGSFARAGGSVDDDTPYDLKYAVSSGKGMLAPLPSFTVHEVAREAFEAIGEVQVDGNYENQQKQLREYEKKLGAVQGEVNRAAKSAIDVATKEAEAAKEKAANEAKEAEKAAKLKREEENEREKAKEVALAKEAAAVAAQAAEEINKQVEEVARYEREKAASAAADQAVREKLAKEAAAAEETERARQASIVSKQLLAQKNAAAARAAVEAQRAETAKTTEEEEDAVPALEEKGKEPAEAPPPSEDRDEDRGPEGVVSDTGLPSAGAMGEQDWKDLGDRFDAARTERDANIVKLRALVRDTRVKFEGTINVALTGISGSVPVPQLDADKFSERGQVAIRTVGGLVEVIGQAGEALLMEEGAVGDAHQRVVDATMAMGVIREDLSALPSETLVDPAIAPPLTTDTVSSDRAKLQAELAEAMAKEQAEIDARADAYVVYTESLAAYKAARVAARDALVAAKKAVEDIVAEIEDLKKPVEVKEEGGVDSSPGAKPSTEAEKIGEVERIHDAMRVALGDWREGYVLGGGGNKETRAAARKEARNLFVELYKERKSIQVADKPKLPEDLVNPTYNDRGQLRYILPRGTRTSLYAGGPPCVIEEGYDWPGGSSYDSDDEGESDAGDAQPVPIDNTDVVVVGTEDVEEVASLVASAAAEAELASGGGAGGDLDPSASPALEVAAGSALPSTDAPAPMEEPVAALAANDGPADGTDDDIVGWPTISSDDEDVQAMDAEGSGSASL